MTCSAKNSAAGESRLQLTQALQTTVALPTLEPINTGRFQGFAVREAAGGLLLPGQAEKVRQAVGTAQGIGLEFLREAVAPTGGDLVRRGPTAAGPIAQNGIRRHGHESARRQP